jgi:hypothetical protein
VSSSVLSQGRLVAAGEPHARYKSPFNIRMTVSSTMWRRYSSGDRGIFYFVEDMGTDVRTKAFGG